MEEVIDCLNATTSPEELAIHFLMRHAKCRMALTGWTEGNLPHGALDDSRLDTPAGEQEVIGSSSVGEYVVPVPAPAATMEDSCLAHFSRAYVAARHMSASRHTMTTAGKAAA